MAIISGHMEHHMNIILGHSIHADLVIKMELAKFAFYISSLNSRLASEFAHPVKTMIQCLEYM